MTVGTRDAGDDDDDDDDKLDSYMAFGDDDFGDGSSENFYHIKYGIPQI